MQSRKIKFTHFQFFGPKMFFLLCISFPSAITMLPAMTYGFVSAYITIALPKYQQPNPTGIILDLNQISWIGKLDFKIMYIRGQLDDR